MAAEQTNYSIAEQALVFNKLRVVVIGYGCLGLYILRALLANPDVEIIGVFPWTKRPKSAIKPDDYEKEFLGLIKKHQLKEIRATSANSSDFIELIKKLEIDTIFIGSWGEILKGPLIGIDNLTIINCHPSKLPDHRGSNPYASVIRMAEQETAVTFHKVDDGIDTGPILVQKPLAVSPDETGESLRHKCGELAGEAIEEVVALLLEPDIIDWGVQDPNQGRYFPKIEVHDGLINWENPYTPFQVRGLHPWLAGLTFIDVKWFGVFSKSLLVAISSVELVDSAELEPYKENLSKLPAQVLPGMVLAYDNGTLWIASPEPRRPWRVEKIKLFAWMGFLPFGLSQKLGCFVFKPGKICHA